RIRSRKVVSYNDEQRTRTRRELSYKTEVKQETYPVVTYRTEKKTKDISFTIQVPTQSVEPFQTTRYETVTEDVVEDYTVNVQVPTTKEVQVQVCKMVPKLVPYTFNPCATATTTSGVAGSTMAGGCGCGSSVATPAPSNGCGCGN
ncbi:MAG: ferredoxin, partial [Pirellula sp.]